MILIITSFLNSSFDISKESSIRLFFSSSDKELSTISSYTSIYIILNLFWFILSNKLFLINNLLKFFELLNGKRINNV